MGKLIVAEFLTLDGVMEASEEWQPTFVTDDVAKEIQASIQASEAMLLGRVTYQMFAAYWPSQTKNEYGIAEKLNSQPKFVVSSTLEKVEWNNSKLIKGNIKDEIHQLKQQIDGNIRLTGSTMLAQMLMQSGLVDEYWLLVHPVVLGRGKRLFSEKIELKNLKLLDSKSFLSGVTLLRYETERSI